MIPWPVSDRLPPLFEALTWLAVIGLAIAQVAS